VPPPALSAKAVKKTKCIACLKISYLAQMFKGRIWEKNVPPLA